MTDIRIGSDIDITALLDSASLAAAHRSQLWGLLGASDQTNAVTSITALIKHVRVLDAEVQRLRDELLRVAGSIARILGDTK